VVSAIGGSPDEKCKGSRYLKTVANDPLRPPTVGTPGGCERFSAHENFVNRIEPRADKYAGGLQGGRPVAFSEGSETRMRSTQIEIRAGTTVLTIDLDYRPWTSDPDPWDLRLPRIRGVYSSGDWRCDRPTREARFSADILSLATGTRSHDIVLILSGVPHLPGINPFSSGKFGSGKTGTVSSIHGSILPGATVRWEVL
jgi:hypothetical protein